MSTSEFNVTVQWRNYNRSSHGGMWEMLKPENPLFAESINRVAGRELPQGHSLQLNHADPGINLVFVSRN